LNEKPAIYILESPEDLLAVEALQRQVWPGSETEVVPAHMLIAAVHNGGLVMGAYDDEVSPMQLVGFVFGFPGLYSTPDGPRLKLHSHMLGVHPGYRNRQIGFLLKRAQWQMVRHQGIDRITWTFDPLLSLNAHLNLARLGAVCNTYLRSVYGELRDGLNAGLPSDRFQVDWWVNSQRVNRRLTRRARAPLSLEHYLGAGVEVLNSTSVDTRGLSQPAEAVRGHDQQPIVLVEIPEDFNALKRADPALAFAWRMHIRGIFEDLFAAGYLATDFIHQPDTYSRSFYVLVNGEATL